MSGGVAAYKAIALTSKLTQKGADVKVIMTQNATEFVTPLTFQAISRNPVYTDTFDEKDPSKIAHIDLADWPDFIVLAPATANILGKIANGIADDMLTTTLLASQAPVYAAPAMNVHMYQHPAVIKNMQTLEEWGYQFIEPGDGYLACGYIGKGRLEEPEKIVELIESHTNRTDQFLNKKILITAGPTQESVDPVRYFTNHSSGKMGYSLAKAAADAGGDIHLVTGPTNLEAPPNVKIYQVTSAQDMFEQVKELYEEMDIIIKSAAVADYRPVTRSDQKMKKQDGNLSIEMERTADILHYLGRHKTKQYLVGFAAETQNLEEYGREKLERKNLDAILINNVGRKDIGFGSDSNEMMFISKKGIEKKMNKATKLQLAYDIMNVIENDIGKD